MKDVRLNKSVCPIELVWLVSLYNASRLNDKNNDSGLFQNIFGFMNESLEIKLEDLCSVFTMISNKLSISNIKTYNK